MGAGIHTYYSFKMIQRLGVVAEKEYPNDKSGVGKVIQKAVEIHVQHLEEKHGLKKQMEKKNS